MTDVETRRALMTNRKLDELAKGYARDILAEVKKNGGDAYDLAHQYGYGRFHARIMTAIDKEV